MDDPYTVLGVPRTASDDDIRRAYRKLAKKHHPDLNQGDPRAEERFKSVSTAYDLLGDAAKRKRFDAGEIDATGAGRPYARRAGPGPGMGAGMGGGGTRYQRYDNYDAFTDAGDLDDVLRGMFGQGANARAGGGKGRDVTYALRVEFRRAIEGGETTVTLADGRSLKVTLPVGLRTPLPFSRSIAPLFEPAGMVSITGPTSVGTSMRPPSTASGSDTGRIMRMSLPSRSSTGSGMIRTSISASPGTPRPPFSPWPRRRMVWPSVRPTGRVTLSERPSASVTVVSPPPTARRNSARNV